MSFDLKEVIWRYFPHFSKNHKKIANAILNHYDKVYCMSSSELAKFVGVSQATVLRFSALLGFDTYSSFKKCIADYSLNNLLPEQRIDFTKEKIDRRDVLKNVIESDIKDLYHTMDMIDRKQFNDAVRLISEAKTIHIFSTDEAFPVALMLYNSLSIIFTDVIIYSTSAEKISTQISNINEFDLMITVSFSENGFVLKSIAKFALSKNAKVLSFLSNSNSKIKEYSSHFLIIKASPVAFMNSAVSYISVINGLIVELTNRHESAVKKKLRTSKEFLSEIEESIVNNEKHK